MDAQKSGSEYMSLFYSAVMWVAIIIALFAIPYGHWLYAIWIWQYVLFSYKGKWWNWFICGPFPAFNAFITYTYSIVELDLKNKPYQHIKYNPNEQ